MATVPRWRDDTSYSSSSSINPYSTATPLVPLMTLAFGRISERAAETYAAHHVKKTSSSNNDKVLRGFTSHVPKPPLSFIQENASTVKPGEVTQANAPATEKVKSIVVDEKEEEGEIEEEEDGEMNELEEGEEGEEEDDVAPSTTPSSEANQPVARKITTVNLKKGHVNRKATPIKAKIGTTHTKAMQHNRKANSSSPMLAGTNPSVAAATSSAVAATASASNNTTNQVANTTSSRGRRGRGRGGRGGNNINNTAK